MTRIGKFLLEFTIICAAVLLGAATIREVFSGAYSISSITVPEQFSKDIQSKDGFLGVFRSEIGKLIREAQTNVAIRPFIPDNNQPELQIAGTNVPLKFIAQNIRDLIGIPYSQINGDLSIIDSTSEMKCYGEVVPASTKLEVSKNKIYRLVLQKSDDFSGPFFDCYGDLASIAMKGAQSALMIIDPYTSATLLTKKNNDQWNKALFMVSERLRDAENKERGSLIRNILSFYSSDVPRGYLALGNLYLAKGDNKAALREFTIANNTYIDRSFFSKDGFQSALDGMSIAYLNTENYIEAEKYAKLSLKSQDNYESALYHLAQSYDFRAREPFRKKEANACSTDKYLREASKIYDRLTDLYPRFAVGYQEHGVLLLQKLDYLMQKNYPACADLPGDDALRAKEITALTTKIDRLFALSTAIDADNDPRAWFQWGILKYKMQDPDLYQPKENNNAERIILLQDALRKYKIAANINSYDAYIPKLIGDVNWFLSELSDGKEKGAYLLESRLSYCRALAGAVSNEELRPQIAQSLSFFKKNGDCE